MRYGSVSGFPFLNYFILTAMYRASQVSRLLENAAPGGKTRSIEGSSHQPKASSLKSTVTAHFAQMKKRKSTDKITHVFWRLLCVLVVFCRLPFSIIESAEFRAFVWFCEATLLFLTWRKINNEFLPQLRKEVANGIHRGLKSVRGVAVSFNLWMSLKLRTFIISLSFDIHYMTEDRGQRTFIISQRIGGGNTIMWGSCLEVKT
jgi:hypothetical protein